MNIANIPTEGEFRARGLVDVEVDSGPPKKSAGFETVHRSVSTGARRRVQDEWVTGWASLDPTYEYPLLDDRRLEGRVRFR
jgi:hypothetical protein